MRIKIICLLIFLCIHSVSGKDMVASWYSEKSLRDEGTWKRSQGRCADGSIFRDSRFIVASNLYPLGTILQVTNKKTKATVTCRVADRISKRFGEKRIDLSKKCFEIISDGQLSLGLIAVSVKTIDK